MNPFAWFVLVAAFAGLAGARLRLRNWGASPIELGLRIHSARQIRDNWQDLRVGDRIALVRPGRLGLKKGHSLPVERIVGI